MPDPPAPSQPAQLPPPAGGQKRDHGHASSLECPARLPSCASRLLVLGRPFMGRAPAPASPCGSRSSLGDVLVAAGISVRVIPCRWLRWDERRIPGFPGGEEIAAGTAGLARVRAPWQSARRGRRCGSSPGPRPGPWCPWERQARTCHYLPWHRRGWQRPHWEVAEEAPWRGVSSSPQAEAGVWQPWFSSVQLGGVRAKAGFVLVEKQSEDGAAPALLVIAAGW